LGSGRGSAFARRAVKRQGLPDHLLEDLTQEVLLRAHRADQRGDVAENVEAFTVTLVQRVAVDMIRGHLRRPEGAFELEPIDEVMDPGDHGKAADETVAAVVGRERAAEVRRVLARLLAHTPAAAAGALAVVAISVDSAAPAADVPVPKGGVDGNEAIAWAGVFYGGGRDCFPGPDVQEDAAMRKRRSRALERQRTALREAALAMVDDTDGDDA
jgi:DNA-directed RNA polymerase specialized sigma24 family protein